jgi:hypothetical protein
MEVGDGAKPQLQNLLEVDDGTTTNDFFGSLENDPTNNLSLNGQSTKDSVFDGTLSRLEALEKQNAELVEIVQRLEIQIQELISKQTQELSSLQQKFDEKAKLMSAEIDSRFAAGSANFVKPFIPEHTTIPSTSVELKQSGVDESPIAGEVHAPWSPRVLTRRQVDKNSIHNLKATEKKPPPTKITHTLVELMLSWFILGLQTLLIPLGYLYAIIEQKFARRQNSTKSQSQSTNTMVAGTQNAKLSFKRPALTLDKIHAH